MTEIAAREMTLTTADGVTLAARMLAPAESRLAVLVSSGTGFPMGFYDRFARHLAARGAAVLAFDFRGVGGSRPEDLAAMRMDYTDWGRLDMPAALEALAEAAPGLPVGHVGHSVGGHFAGFMENHGGIARHAFVSVGSGYWGQHHRAYNPMELFFWFGLGPWHLMRHGHIRRGMFWRGADLPRGVYETWRRWCLKAAYFRDELKDRLAPHWFDKIEAPIRSWIFTDDPIATPETGRFMLDLYERAPRSMTVRRPADHGVKRIGHEGAFRRGMEPLWDEIFDWLADGEASEAPYIGGSPNA